MKSPEVLLATRNAGKLHELRPLFMAAGWRVCDLDGAGIPAASAEDAIEAYSTFEKNARAKARYFFALAGGRPVVAEDSGLEVTALGGAPGVRSKRWSERPELSGVALDDANNALLVERLRGVGDRRARYVCAAVYWDGTFEAAARGETTGVIGERRAAGSGGFGYDPYFVSDELGRSFADVSTAEKAGVSHRGRAIASLLRLVDQRR